MFKRVSARVKAFRCMFNASKHVSKHMFAMNLPRVQKKKRSELTQISQLLPEMARAPVMRCDGEKTSPESDTTSDALTTRLLTNISLMFVGIKLMLTKNSLSLPVSLSLSPSLSLTHSLSLSYRPRDWSRQHMTARAPCQLTRL